MPNTHNGHKPHEWMDRAACVGTDPEIFFPARGHSEVAEQAVAICDNCPVKLPCVKMALRNERSGYEHGIWGGTTTEDRKWIKANRLITV